MAYFRYYPKEYPNDSLASVIEMHRDWYIKKVGTMKPEWYVFPFPLE